jgi:hypothetical protein
VIDPGSDISNINISYVQKYMIGNSVAAHTIKKFYPLKISKLQNQVKIKLGTSEVI